MAQTILGIFDDPLAARRAMETLRDGSMDLDDVSIISRATATGAPVGSADEVSAREGAAVGAVWGGLIGLASLLIPGVGPFIAIGALGAALTGAVTGAVVGGIAAALIDFGDISPEEAHAYEQQIHAGMTLVAVKARDEDAHEVRRVLAAAGASSIRDNQTDITSGMSTPVGVVMEDAGGQPVNVAREFGAPADSATVRRGIYDTPDVDMPTIDRPGDAVQPRVAPAPTLDTPVAAGRTQQLDARPSGSYAGAAADVTTPETLGVPPAAGPDTSIGDDRTPIGAGRAGQVQPRHSGAGIEHGETEADRMPDAPQSPPKADL